MDVGAFRSIDSIAGFVVLQGCWSLERLVSVRRRQRTFGSKATIRYLDVLDFDRWPLYV